MSFWRDGEYSLSHPSESERMPFLVGIDFQLLSPLRVSKTNSRLGSQDRR